MILAYCKRSLLHIAIPILCGIAVYALWRGIYIVDIPPILASRPPDWVIYNLPDGLWLYAFLSSIVFIWEEEFSWYFILWAAIVVVLSCLTEIMQAYNFINGTFDWNDMLAYLIAVMLSGIQFYNKMKNSF